MSIISKWLVIVVFDFNKIPHCTVQKINQQKKTNVKQENKIEKKPMDLFFLEMKCIQWREKTMELKKITIIFHPKFQRKKDYAVELFLFFHFSIYFSTTRKTVVKITEDIELKKMGNQWFKNSSNHEELGKKYHKQKPTYKGYK